MGKTVSEWTQWLAWVLTGRINGQVVPSSAPAPDPDAVPANFKMVPEAGQPGVSYYLDPETERQWARMPKAFVGIIGQSGMLDTVDTFTPPFSGETTPNRDTSDSEVSRDQDRIDQIRHWAQIWRAYPSFAAQEGIPRVFTVPTPGMDSADVARAAYAKLVAERERRTNRYPG